MNHHHQHSDLCTQPKSGSARLTALRVKEEILSVNLLQVCWQFYCFSSFSPSAVRLADLVFCYVHWSECWWWFLGDGWSGETGKVWAWQLHSNIKLIFGSHTFSCMWKTFFPFHFFLALYYYYSHEKQLLFCVSEQESVSRICHITKMHLV